MKFYNEDKITFGRLSKSQKKASLRHSLSGGVIEYNLNDGRGWHSIVKQPGDTWFPDGVYRMEPESIVDQRDCTICFNNQTQELLIKFDKRVDVDDFTSSGGRAFIKRKDGRAAKVTIQWAAD